MDSKAHYPSDKTFVANLAADTRAQFAKYMDDLDAENVSRGHPYGKESLWVGTGAECWWSYFEDGYSPSAAFDEDQSYD